jgi:hypothetical protein
MSNIQSRLNSLQPFVIGVRFERGLPIVDAVFKEAWHVPKSEVIESTKGDSDEVNYHMFFTQKENLGIDEILNYIEKIIGLNIEREKKHALLKVKAKELQELFKKHPLSKLQDMRFVLSGEKLIQDMEPDPLDAVDIDFNIDPDPIVDSIPQPNQQPSPQPNPQPNPQPQPVVDAEAPIKTVTDESYVRRAPNGEIIPPLTPEDTGEIKEDFSTIDLTQDEEPIVTKKVKGQNIDLPNKKAPTIELEDFEPPQNVVCKCVGEEVCPACMEEKIGSY